MGEVGGRRADARRNRERLVQAATVAFAEHGPAASLDAIARSAGVGSGTLYRHFPSREDLVRAVYRTQIDDVCRRGRALSDARDPLEAVREWLRLIVVLATRNGPSNALVAETGPWPRSFADECHAALSDAGGVLLERARSQLRPEVTLDDLHALAYGIAIASDSATTTDRRLTLLLDGARARHG